MAATDSDKARADQLHEEALSIEDEDAALQAYQQVLALDPDRAMTHYNIGLIHKYRGNWQASMDSNLRAVALSPQDESSNWNLAIAATALKKWDVARAAWNRLGIEIEEGTGPIDADFGIAPVRLNPDHDAEVVWGRRIDPVRVRIENIPYPSSGYRFGDIVLHDGAAVGYRTSGNREYGVFNVFELFQPSSLGTFELQLHVDHHDKLTDVGNALDAAGFIAENWSFSVRILCRACSEGRPHSQHDKDQRDPSSMDHCVFGLAAQSESADHADLEGRIKSILPKGVSILSFDLKLPTLHVGHKEQGCASRA
jgi:tetratricopeptide (TPR) repeat protein